MYARGYSNKCLMQVFNKTKILQRRDRLFNKKKVKTDKTMPFITEFSNQEPELRKILTKNWPLLLGDTKIKQILSEKPAIMFKRAPCIKDHLVKAILLGRGRRLRKTREPFPVIIVNFVHGLITRDVFIYLMGDDLKPNILQPVYLLWWFTS